MTQAPRAFTDYRSALLMAVQEEIAGEAYFARLAELHGGRARLALTLLARVEAATAVATLPLLARHGIASAPAESLQHAGRAEADRDGRTPWPQFVAAMAETYPAFTAEFEQIAALAPPEDAALCAVLVDHEVAVVDFARLETEGNADSLAPLEAFLTRHER